MLMMMKNLLFFSFTFIKKKVPFVIMVVMHYSRVSLRHLKAQQNKLSV